MASPNGTRTDGNTLIKWVPSIADATAPAATEINAAGAKDLSCWFTADGWNPALSEDTIQDQRLCDTQTYERKGRNQRSLSVKYIENPLAADQAANNVAFVTLAPGSLGFFVIRKGVPVATAVAAAQLVDVWPVEMGEYDDQPPEANSMFKYAQKAFVRNTVTKAKAVV